MADARFMLMRETDPDCVDIMAQEDDVHVVHAMARQILLDLGVIRMSYHFTPPFHSQTSERTIIYSLGFPEAWLRKYNDPEFRKRDPIPDIIMAQHDYMSWERALALCPNRTRAERWRAELAEFDLLDGIGIPVYGPGGRDAYSAFAIGRPFTQKDRPLIRRIREVAQTTHLRTAHLVLEEINHGTQLSMRETEVLSWVIAGKSRNDIATILAISNASVDTYLRRIFEKLEVNDRIKASLRALSRGLILLD